MDEKYCKGYVPIGDIPGARVLSITEWLAIKNPSADATEFPLRRGKNPLGSILKQMRDA